jgi:hypothetical protein
MKAFYRHFNLQQYPNITMGRDPGAYFFSYFKASSVPYTAVFDAQKRLKKVFILQTDAKSLLQAIKD